MRKVCLAVGLGLAWMLLAAVDAQQVIAPGHVPPAAPLPRYVYNVVAADFAIPAGNPLVKTKFNVYDPVGAQMFDNSVSKMSELRVNTYRLELGWGRGRGGRDVTGTLEHPIYNFQALDHIVQQLRTQGVQLLGSYCYTPTPLQDPKLEARYGEGNQKQKADTPPKDLAKWEEIITAYVKHYREIGIPFGVHEVWNEPDGTYGFFSGTEAEYQQLYKATVEAVRAADPDAEVAGPGSDHHLLWNNTFIDFVAANRLPLDYYSFHEYGSGGLAVRQVERAAASVNRYPALNTTALSLDEWHDGECCSWCNDDVRNHYEGAPELLHDFTLLLERPELASVSWAWWQDPGGRGAGCMGLVSADGRRKAVFNAWKLLANMPVDRRDVTVEGELEGVASNDAHKAGLLVWNRSSYDRRVDIQIKNLPFRTGTVRVYRVDSKHGSPIDGGDENITALETYPLSAASWSYLDGQVPKYGVMYFEATDGSNVSELDQVSVGKVIRVNRYYPARGKTKSYADFDGKTWIARLGMMGDNADQEIGVLAEGLPDAIDVTTTIEGKLQKVDANSLFGIRIDYRVNGKFTKAVWWHGPYAGMDLGSRKKAMQWGLKADVDQSPAAADFAKFRIPLKRDAPTGWGGQAHISFVLQNAGPTARAKIVLREGM